MKYSQYIWRLLILIILLYFEITNKLKSMLHLKFYIKNIPLPFTCIEVLSQDERKTEISKILKSEIYEVYYLSEGFKTNCK